MRGGGIVTNRGCPGLDGREGKSWNELPPGPRTDGDKEHHVNREVGLILAELLAFPDEGWACRVRIESKTALS